MVATRNIISQNIMVVVLVKCSNLGGEWIVGLKVMS
jgi:hypothetical protein